MQTDDVRQALFNLLEPTHGLSSQSQGPTGVLNDRTGGTSLPPKADITTGSDDTFSRLAAEMERLRLVQESNADILTDNTRAVSENTSAQAGRSGSSTLGTIGKSIGKLALNATGIGALVSGITGLFSGDEPEPIPLPTYTPPAPIHWETVLASSQRATSGQSHGASSSPVAGTSAQPTPIQINVQAIDSRSFLDHSDAIARAVKQAMLNSNALNDVVNEL